MYLLQHVLWNYRRIWFQWLRRAGILIMKCGIDRRQNASRLSRWVFGCLVSWWVNTHLGRRRSQERTWGMRMQKNCGGWQGATLTLAIHCLCSSHEWEQVTKSTTPWQPWWLMTLTANPTDLLWRPMWLDLTTRDDPSDDKKTTLTTLMTLVDDLIWHMWWLTGWRPSKISWRHLMTPSGDTYCQSRKLPVLQLDARTAENSPFRDFFRI